MRDFAAVRATPRRGVVERFAVEVHAYALMSNHFHLLVHCPDGELSEAMQRLCGRFGAAYNQRIAIARPGVHQPIQERGRSRATPSSSRSLATSIGTRWRSFPASALAARTGGRVSAPSTAGARLPGVAGHWCRVRSRAATCVGRSGVRASASGERLARFARARRVHVRRHRARDRCRQCRAIAVGARGGSRASRTNCARWPSRSPSSCARRLSDEIADRYGVEPAVDPAHCPAGTCGRIDVGRLRPPPPVDPRRCCTAVERHDGCRSRGDGSGTNGGARVGRT